jgi:hypothetical protein
LNATSEGAKNSNPRQFNQITIAAVLSTKRNIELWQLLANGATRIVGKTVAKAAKIGLRPSRIFIFMEELRARGADYSPSIPATNTKKARPKPADYCRTTFGGPET